MARVRGGLQTLDMVAPFANKDVNGNGKITIDEFKHAIESLGLDIKIENSDYYVHDLTVMVMVTLITNHFADLHSWMIRKPWKCVGG